jgi:copper resistance protein C
VRAAAAALIVAATALVAPSVAAAHPRLLSLPSFAGKTIGSGSPRSVTIGFSEPVDAVGAGIIVTGPTGADAAVGPARRHGDALTRPIDSHEHGTYVVEWLVVGRDSHPARGAFLFSVGEQTRSALPGGSRSGVTVQALARWLSLAGLALGFGVPFAAALSGGMIPRLWRLVSAGVALMIVAEPVALLGETTTLAPSRAFDPGLARDVLLTSYGHVTGLRLGAALGLWALTGAVRQGSARALWAIPALGAALAVVHADASHRIAGLPSVLSLLLAAAHVAAFGAWLGCVIVAIAAGRRRALARNAATAVLLLVLTGAGLAFGHLTAVADLFHTAYGGTLAVKGAVVALALALGATARHRVELAAALGALGAAALLVSLLPPV